MTIKNVVDGGFCIGCGACTAVDARVRIQFNKFGDLQAELAAGASAELVQRLDAVCPFSAAQSETDLARQVFDEQPVRWHPEIGASVSTLAARSKAHHAAGSSGGMVTWVLAELLKTGRVDHVVHVAPSPGRADGRFFSYRISSTLAEVNAGATSFYYPVSMDEVLAQIRSTPGRYAITAVPCFHKALRQLRKLDPVLDQRIAYQVGIVCGQMKSAHYLEYLAAQAGVAGRALSGACFRRKVDGRPASDYAFEAVTGDAAPAEVHRVMNSRIGVNWGMGYFKPKACDFCDDVFAETADMAAMDAWLPQYVKPGPGWSLVVCRTSELASLVSEAAGRNELIIDVVDSAAVCESQRGGLNHRRLALPYRLWLNRSVWTPAKRMEPSRKLSWVLKLEQRLRGHLRARSREVWLQTRHADGGRDFARQMKVAEQAYRWLARLKRHFL